MDWIIPFYTRRSEQHGPTGVLPHHRARASTIARLCGPAPRRVLELGAGAGGTAAATADLGYEVVAVELTPLRAAYAREIAHQPGRERFAVIEGDFYTVALEGQFDVVTYWDGFGIGADADQRRLLHRIAAEWLAPGGCALLEVFPPWAWAHAAGREERDEEHRQISRLAFDWSGSRFVEYLWNEGQPEAPLRQSIRCYAPVDLALLLEGTGLQLDRVEVSGEELLCVDDGGEIAVGGEDSGPTAASEHLATAWSYLVRLVTSSRATAVQQG